MTLVEKQQRLIEDLAIIPDRQERLAAVVDRGRAASKLLPSEKTDANRVPGCVSAVWLVGELQDGKVRLRVDADSPLVKGLVVFLCDAYDNTTPEEISVNSTDILELTGLTRDLSPTRRNGLAAVLNRIKTLASTLR